jgi:membrane protease YdiL (CAAX protease family)
MAITRIRRWFYSLTKLETLMALTIITIAALLLFRLPFIDHYKGIYFNEIFQYFFISLFGVVCVLVLKPPTVNTFTWPKISWLGAFAFIFAIAWVIFEIDGGYMIKQPLRVKVAGVIYLLAIGFAEELISRVLIFGSLRRFGVRFAVLASSAIFGLMHINVYLPDWSSWAAYWHVMSATGFGLFCCALFIATRSFWIVALFHALSDWTVVFDMRDTVNDSSTPGILEGIWWGFENLFFSLALMGLAILYVLRGRWPKWAIKLAIRWKLVEQAETSVK